MGFGRILWDLCLRVSSGVCDFGSIQWGLVLEDSMGFGIGGFNKVWDREDQIRFEIGSI
ncbi:hypothetical protein DPMN_180129 [Dreissena polymorpha]|uniref:Uncharacterized protein n=1 Tax=Dreissena polymorpha TaxID=45954 RepID=A0A9D4EDM4_DREPO|nr:hypothetical protein DPMN_180129 [Dreissena polymorpha]